MHAKVRVVALVAGIALMQCPASAASDHGSPTASNDRKSPKKSGHKEHAKSGDAKQAGKASFYSKHLAGKKTSSGEPYDPKRLTAAHRSLPLGTQVKVKNPKNDKSVVVTVNDRGPVPKDRMIDLSNAAASELGMTKAGVAKVETEVVGKKELPKASGDNSSPPRPSP